MGRIPAILAILAVATAAVAGCKKKKKPEATEPARDAAAEPLAAITWAIADVGVELVAEQGSELDIDAQGLARRIGSALRASDAFTTGEGEAAAGRVKMTAELRARITYGLIPEGSIGRPSTFVSVEGALSPDDEDELTLRDNVVTERPVPPGEEGAAIDAALIEQIGVAADEMVDGVIAKEALRRAGADPLRQALTGDADRVQWALQIIADREIRELVEPVRALLRSADGTIADAAIGAAVALGDKEAVSALTEGIDFMDHERMRVVIEASAALGGDEAIQFLEFVTTGHEDPDIKAHAADALGRLRDRSK
jgi:hypothetical protein